MPLCPTSRSVSTIFVRCTILEIPGKHELSRNNGVTGSIWREVRLVGPLVCWHVVVIYACACEVTTDMDTPPSFTDLEHVQCCCEFGKLCLWKFM